MLSKIKKTIVSNVKNIPGWRTNRKIVVFESDDWGSYRAPSREVYQKLIDGGIKIQKSVYDKYDALENPKDLELLYEVLGSVKDKNNNPAVYTPFVNTANPDFAKIKQDNFSKYHFEPFYDTIDRFGGNSQEVLKLYRQGIDANMFVPQYHGREHLTVLPWLASLQKGDKDALFAFDNEYYSVPLDGTPKHIRSFRPAFYFDRNEEMEFLSGSLKSGAEIFNKAFGYNPTVFDPSNGIFHPMLEETLKEIGVNTVVVNRVRDEPDGNGQMNKKYFNFGGTNKLGQVYHIRNCQFELYEKKGADYCMNDIATAFRWNKPAVITSHRINFVGGMDEAWRDQNLKELATLLKKIKQKWPNVEFMGSGELSDIMRKELVK